MKDQEIVRSYNEAANKTKHKKTWSQEDDAKLCALYTEELSWEEIGKHFGVTSKAAEMRHWSLRNSENKVLKQTPTKRFFNWTNKTIDLLIYMKNNKFDNYEIAQAVGTTPSSVNAMFYKLKKDMPDAFNVEANRGAT